MNSQFRQPDFDELLSAFMDGELPADEARFLQRRMQHDAALRERWERWQLASACLRGQPVRMLETSAVQAVAAAMAADQAPQRLRNLAGWSLAAALAVAIALVPRLGSEQSGRAAVAAASNAEAPVNTPAVELLMAAGMASNPVSPAVDIRELPLAVNAQRKPWPRSPLIGQGPGAQALMQARHTLDVPAAEPGDSETPRR